MIRLQIALGVILTLIGLLVVAWIGVNEEQRLDTATAQWQARRIETGAELYEINCAICHGEDAQGIQGLAPPLNDRQMLEERLEEVGWAGSLHGYLMKTIAGGRIVSTRPDQYVGNMPDGDMAMPAWSTEFGGPLSQYEIENIAMFLENFTEFSEEQLAMKEAAEEEAAPPEGEEGDVTARGRQVFIDNGCGGCHVLDDANGAGVTGPQLNDIGTVAAERIEAPDYEGEATSAEEYIHESIVAPNAYVVEGYPANVMPQTFEETIPEGDLDALVEYLSAQQ